MSTWRFPVDLSWGGSSGSPGVNVWHFRTADPVDPGGDMETISGILEDFYTAKQSLHCGDYVARFNGEVQGVGDGEGDSEFLTPWTVNGTTGLDHLAPALQMMVSWRTNSGGRNGRGRTFVGPLATTVHEDNGTPDEPDRTILINAAADLVEASDTFANGALGVYSRVENVFRDFTSSQVPNYFAILRSRRD